MRKQSRDVVFKMLFAYNFGQKDEQQSFDELLDVITKDLNINKDELDLQYVKSTINAIIENMDTLKDIVYSKINKYASNRVYNADLIILVLATYELQQKALDNKIVISEALKLAKKYSTEKSIKFINGVLGAIIKE